MNTRTATLPQGTIQRRGTGLTAYDPELSEGGYTLYTPVAGRGEVFLIDIEGNIVHEWSLPYPPGRHARLLPNGNLLYQGKIEDQEPLFPIWGVYHGGIIAEVAPDGRIIREVRHPRHHHDASLLRNGNLAVLTVEELDPDVAHRIPGGTPGTEAPGGVIYGDVIVELTWSGEVVRRWSVAEQMDPSELSLDHHFAREHWPMANTINETAEGQLIVGFRSASTIIAIQPDGEIAWRFGAPHVSQQHYPHQLANGNVLVFDNGSFREGVSYPYSRALEINPWTQEEVWSYEDNPPQNFYSPYMSSAQRLPGGNTVVAEGSFGRIFEVTHQGQVVWEFVVPQFPTFRSEVGLDSNQGPNNSIFRAYRYSAQEVKAVFS